jgi:ABC-type multidrug transport system ATPase subunit
METYSIGMVPQDDIMHDDFSVEENLLFSAEWRLNHSKFSQPVRRGVVEDVLRRLQMSERRSQRVGRGSDTVKGHISGGQKKRVNIGMELVADPSILFLDEPTSGLDSTTTVNLIRMLKDLTRNASVTVATILHQPPESAFREFDDLLLLVAGGSTIYHGKADAAVAYFSARGFEQYVGEYANPADFLMDIVGGEIAPGLSKLTTQQDVSEYDYKTTPYKWWREHTKAADFISQRRQHQQPPLFLGLHAGALATMKQQLSVFVVRSIYLVYKQFEPFDLVIVSLIGALCACARLKAMEKTGNNLIASEAGNKALALGAAMVRPTHIRTSTSDCQFMPMHMMYLWTQHAVALFAASNVSCLLKTDAGGGSADAANIPIRSPRFPARDWCRDEPHILLRCKGVGQLTGTDGVCTFCVGRCICQRSQTTRLDISRAKTLSAIINNNIRRHIATVLGACSSSLRGRKLRDRHFARVP